MNLNEYQEHVKKRTPKSLACAIMGLNEEAGEVAGVFKKSEFYSSWADRSEEEVLNLFAEELGDVLFYVTSTANKLGLSLEDILKQNAEKTHSFLGGK